MLTVGIETRLKQLVLEKQTEYGYEVLDMEVMLDHVHLLLNIINPQNNPVKVVGQSKFCFGDFLYCQSEPALLDTVRDCSLHHLI